MTESSIEQESNEIEKLETSIRDSQRVMEGLKAGWMEAMDSARSFQNLIQARAQDIRAMETRLESLKKIRNDPSAVTVWVPVCKQRGCKWMKEYKGSESKDDAINIAKSHKTKNRPHTVKVERMIRFRKDDAGFLAKKE